MKKEGKKAAERRKGEPGNTGEGRKNVEQGRSKVERRRDARCLCQLKYIATSLQT